MAICCVDMTWIGLDGCLVPDLGLDSEFLLRFWFWFRFLGCIRMLDERWDAHCVDEK